MRFPIDNLFDEMFSGFGDDFFDDPFDTPRLPGGEHQHGLMRPPKVHTHGLMRTDVNETDKAYELAIELPGLKKDDIKVKLDNGVLTVSTETHEETEERETPDGKPRKNGKVIRRERHYGAMSRSWYVGDDVERLNTKTAS